jgi:hypothetical protein
MMGDALRPRRLPAWVDLQTRKALMAFHAALVPRFCDRRCGLQAGFSAGLTIVQSD